MEQATATRLVHLLARQTGNWFAVAYNPERGYYPMQFLPFENRLVEVQAASHA